MIVANKEKSIALANELSKKLLAIMTEELKNFDCPDDPAEQVYLGVHTVAALFARVCISIDNFGRIYGIPKMTPEIIISWINSVAKEHIELNKEIIE